VIEPGKVTTDNFGVTGGRNDIILKDRDLGTPLYFLKVKKDEQVNITASLRVNPLSSHVCVSTYSYHVDPEKALADRETFLEANPGQESLFDNFYKQKSFHTNEKGRPDWFDFTVESIGVIPAVELVKDAITLIKKRIVEWVKTEIVRENEANVYMITTETEGHTLGALIQAVLYESGLVDFVSYDVPHPLRSEMRVRFLTEKTTDEIMSYVSTKVAGYCDTCLGIL
jgi:DNA-directed RNA polymerase subunit L